MRDNPYEIYAITNNVAVAIEAIVLNTTDTGTVNFKFTPSTKSEVLCHFRIQLEAFEYNKWPAVGRHSYVYVDSYARWSSTVVELPIADPC